MRHFLCLLLLACATPAPTSTNTDTDSDSGTTGATGTTGSTGQTNTAPVASIDTPAADGAVVLAGGTLSFTATCTDADPGSTLTHSWSFGSTQEDPGEVTFSTPGMTTVTYTCSDGTASSSASRTIYVNSAPAVSVAPSGSPLIATGGGVTFSATCVDGDAPLTHAWTFAGGTPASASDASPGSVTFSTAGAHDVSYTCTDAYGASTTVQSVVNADDPPVVSIDAPTGPVLVNQGDSVTFAASCSDSDTPVTHDWSFGSTIEDPGAVPFNSPGSIDVTYTCTDALGLPAHATVTVTVNAKPVAVIDDASPVTVTEGASVTLTGTCTDESPSTVTHRWTFDGVQADSLNEDPNGVAFPFPGVYVVTYQCTDVHGAASNVATKTVTVNRGYTVGGRATGLFDAGLQVIVEGETLAVDHSGEFTMPTKLADTTPFSVSVQAPTGYTCNVNAAADVIAGADYRSLLVFCRTGMLFVTTAGTGDFSGSSWANASNDINLAGPTGTAIFVAGGTYKATGPTGSPLTVSAHNAYYGGMAGTEATLFDRVDPLLSPTVLDGDLLGDGRTADDSPVLIGVSNGATRLDFDGFTLQNANAPTGAIIVTNLAAVFANVRFIDNYGHAGSALTITSSTVELDRCDFLHNTQESSLTTLAGTVLADGASVILRDVTFYDNFGDYAGALNTHFSTLDAKRSAFIGNGANQLGGALYLRGDASLEDVLFFANTSSLYGGGLELDFGSLQMSRAMFAVNSAHYGGGVMLEGGNATITDAAFQSNSASNTGSALYVGSDTHTLRYASLTNNSLTSAVQVDGGALTVSESATYNDGIVGATGSNNCIAGSITFDAATPSPLMQRGDSPCLDLGYPATLPDRRAYSTIASHAPDTAPIDNGAHWRVDTPTITSFAPGSSGQVDWTSTSASRCRLLTGNATVLPIGVSGAQGGLVSGTSVFLECEGSGPPAVARVTVP